MPLGPISQIDQLALQGAELAVGIGIGVQLASALTPEGTSIRQEFWSSDPNSALSPADAATIVAQAIQSLGWGEIEATNSGINTDRFGYLQEAAIRAPAVGELLALIRRNTVSGEDFTHGLRKAQLDARYDNAIRQLAQQPLGVEAVATMIQRGIIPDQGQLPFAPNTAGADVPPMPVVNIDANEQAAWWGISPDQLSALARIVGLPASPDLAARMYYRGIINEPSFNLAVAEGNTRNEWAPFLLEGFRQILTAHDYAELQLRGFLTQDQRRAGTAKHGMSSQDSDLLYDVLGRAPAAHTITKGLAYGGTYGGTGEGVPEVYKSALERGNLRPEYYDIAYHDRYLWPSAFVLRTLVQGGELSGDDGEKVLTYSGWEPGLAKKVATTWAAGVTAAADKHVGKAETQVWGKLHTSYVNRLSTKAEAQADLAAIGVSAAAIPQVLSLWDIESAIERRSLSSSELKKAVKDGLMTAQQATQRLLDLGYSSADAGILLAE